MPADETLQLSAESERRRRSLEASYDAEATPDMFNEARTQQEQQPSASRRLDSGSSEPADGKRLRRGSSPYKASAQPAAQPSATPGRRRPPKRKAAAAAPAAQAAAAAAEAAPAALPPQPAKQMMSAVVDDADRSDHQVLNGALRGNCGGAALLALRRATRRATGQGRIENASETPGSMRTASKQPERKPGPAETFLRALQERLYRARSNSKHTTASDAVTWYLNAMGNSTVLTRNEEMQLGAIIHLGAQVTKAQAELRADDGSEAPLSEVAHHLQLRSAATVRQRLRNAALAKTLLLQYNVRLVMSVARQYANRGVELPDLLPAGIGGLERAIERFDASKGFKFSTYAHWWIRQAISRCVQDQSRVVRLPVNVYELISKINKVSSRLNTQPGRSKPASYAEIGEALGIPEARVAQVVRVSREARSLDVPIDSGGRNKNGDPGPMLVDTLEADAAESSEDTSQKMLREQVDLALKGLDLRPRNILRYRYGLHHALGRPLTLNEVGELYGLKGERVRQIEGVAMAMLKKGLEHGLRSTLEESKS